MRCIFKSLFLNFFVIIGLVACVHPPAPTISPFNENSVVWHSNVSSDTVILIAQGGPEKSLGIIEKGRTRYRYIPGYDEYTIGYVHQAQTLDLSFWDKGLEFSKKDARAAMELSVSMLVDAAAQSRENGKRVIVIGHSYGAFLALQALVDEGVFADQVIISAGRLQTPSEMISDHDKGVTGSFAEDGTTYFPYVEDEIKYSNEEKGQYHIKNLIKWAADDQPTLDKIEKLDLRTVRVFYARNDQNVGRLSEVEVSVLENAGATVFANDRGHSDT